MLIEQAALERGIPPATLTLGTDNGSAFTAIKAARFPARKTLEEFDFAFQRSVKRQVIEHLGQRN